ncbi:MAG: hypothetical protein WCA63_00775 [Gallionella sp.]
MRKIIFAALATLLAMAPAHAGSITFTITDSADGTLTKTYTQFSDANITNWIAAYQQPCNLSIQGTCARAQVLNYIVQSMVNQWVGVTNFYNKQQAAVPTISIAP